MLHRWVFPITCNSHIGMLACYCFLTVTILLLKKKRQSEALDLSQEKEAEKEAEIGAIKTVRAGMTVQCSQVLSCDYSPLLSWKEYCTKVK